jgi:hypothetical protein
MGVRTMSTERLIRVSTRLLAGASLLTMLGLGLTLWYVWRQMGQAYGPDGTAGPVDAPFSQRLTMLTFEASYRTWGVQLLLASALVAAALVALHRLPSSRVGSMVWEVLAAGVLALLLAVALTVPNIYVLTAPEGTIGDAAAALGPAPLGELALSNLSVLGASLLLLTAAALWWWRLGAEPNEGPERHEDAEDLGDSHDNEDSGDTDDHVHPTSDSVPTRAAATEARPVDEPVKDYSRDWSPEDFLPPR